MRYALFWEITQSIVVIIYLVWDKKLLKMGKIGCLDTSMNNYQYTLRNYPEERRPIFLSRSVF